MRILFLDLDGTIRETKSGQKFINDPYDQQPIKGAYETCDRYHKAGWELIGITNQKGVMMGYKSVDAMILEQQETLRIFPQLWKIYACPDDGKSMIVVNGDRYAIIDNDSDSLKEIEKLNFRKPNTGMIRYFLETHNPIQQALMVGDMESDQLCAINANIPFMWVHLWLEDEMSGCN